MKKAKEYAAELRASPTDKTLAEIASQFFGEVLELKNTRSASSSSAYIAILDEQDRKWQAFARHFEGIIKPNGFEMLVKDKSPELYVLWRGPLAWIDIPRRTQ